MPRAVWRGPIFREEDRRECAKPRLNPKVVFVIMLGAAFIASSPSFGGRGLEVRVGQRGDYPHPNPLPRMREREIILVSRRILFRFKVSYCDRRHFRDRVIRLRKKSSSALRIGSQGGGGKNSSQHGGG